MKLDIGSYLRPCFGERVIGDAIVSHNENGHTFLIVIDGIGHGPEAGSISKKIKEFVQRNWIQSPAKLIEKIHDHMKGSDGAVIGVSIINHEKEELVFAGLGNISCRIKGEESKLMISADGLIGVRFRSVENAKVQLKNKDMVIMHSDGVSSTHEMTELLNRGFSSRILAKKIVQEFGSDYDDSSCLIAKCKLD